MCGIYIEKKCLGNGPNRIFVPLSTCGHLGLLATFEKWKRVAVFLLVQIWKPFCHILTVEMAEKISNFCSESLWGWLSKNSDIFSTIVTKIKPNSFFATLIFLRKSLSYWLSLPNGLKNAISTKSETAGECMPAKLGNGDTWPFQMRGMHRP